MTLSFRSKLLASHVALVLVVGGIALFTLDRVAHEPISSASSISASRSRARARSSGPKAASAIPIASPRASRTSSMPRSRSSRRTARCIGASTPEARADVGPEVAAAQAGAVGKARARRAGQEFHYVAVPGTEGTVLRLAQPLSEINETVGAMRRRLLFASTLAVLAAIVPRRSSRRGSRRGRFGR